MQVAVARQLYVAKDKAEAEAALERAAACTKRTVEVSRAAGRQDRLARSVLCGHARRTEANALYGTPDEICEKLEAHRKAGVEYILLTMHGGKEQLRRFARDVMPAFAGRRRMQGAEPRAKLAPFETNCRVLVPLASATFP